MRVTVGDLRAMGACEVQVLRFEEEWPSGVEVSLAALLHATEIGLDLGWWADRVLSAPARAAFDEATAPAWAALGEATATALWRIMGGDQA